MPQDYTGSYGTNGFHLKFDSSGYNGSGGIGADHSGNGNDFTASGFDTGDVALYSPNVVSSTGSFYSGQGPELMFDGSSSTYTQSSTQGGTVTWTPSQTITYSSSVVVRSQRNAGDQCVFNGSTTVSMAAGGVPGETTIATGSGTISSMAFSGYYGGSVQYIKVDGTILIDNTDNDVDYFDTPTSNYAVINVIGSTNQTAEEANLRSRASGGTADPDPPGLTVYKIPSDGDFYFECITDYGIDSSFGSWSTGFFVDTEDIDHSTFSSSSIYTGGIGFVVELASNNYNNNANLGVSAQQDITTDGSTFSSAVCGVRIKNNQITITRNGAATNVTNTTFSKLASTGDGFYRIYSYNYYGSSDPNGWTRWNFGQRPYVNAPSGVTPEANGIQTNNLAEPTIKDGSDHFQAITGAGNTGGLLYAEDANDTSARSVTRPLGTLTDPSASGSNIYTPYTGNGSTYSWIWDAGGIVSSSEFTVDFHGSTFTVRSSEDGINWNTESDALSGDNTITSTNSHRYVRIQGPNWGVAAGSQKMSSSDGLPILSVAQAAFPNGLWWIKDRQNSNNHQLVSSEYSGVIGCPTAGSYQSNFPTYAAPSGNSVAWCWGTDATGLNEEAGFEIIQQLGTLTYTTVNHRLGKEPKMIIAFAGRGDLALTMYHASLGPNYRATMSSALQFYNEPAWWGGDPTDFDENTFGVGPTAYTNDNENFNGGMTYFVWTDIPGYSAFGDYVGNSSSDGPYIYTGFRPSMILYKCATTTGNWHFRDTTRSVYNPAEAALYANLQYVESTPGNSGNYVDILSNGFKITNGDGDQNTSGQTYIWAAWAENPFGGEKQPPVTAR